MALTVLAALAIFIMLAFFLASITSWVLAMMVIVPVVAIMARFSDDVLVVIGAALFLFIVFFGIPFMRRNVVSGAVFKLFRKVLPQISATEQEAIDAGTVWWDGELFSGNPDWDKLLAFPKCGLSAREQAFLDNEVEQLCAMLDDWGHHPQSRRPAPRSLAIHQGSRIFWHDHSAALWRAGVFRASAFGSGEQSGFAQRHGCGDGDGAEFPGAGRTIVALRHRRAKGKISASSRPWLGSALFCADRPIRRIGCRRDS